MCNCVTLSLVVLMLTTFVEGRYHPDERIKRAAHGGHQHDETPDMLFNKAKSEIMRAKSIRRNYGLAKNVILVVGDGFGMSTITASRIYKAQYVKGLPHGEESKLSFENFPNVGLSKTYSVDRQVTDSAATATAMLTGLKTNYGVLGVPASVPYGKNCSELTPDRKLKSVLDRALEAGKSVGIVTTTRVTHATPGAAYAHTNNRDWESDTDLQKGAEGDCDNVDDIALDLVENNPNINVVLGGGWRSFIPNTLSKPDGASIDSHQRRDGKNLIQQWIDDKSSRNLRHAFVENTQQLRDVDAVQTDYLFGLFSKSHMSYEANRDQTPTGQPSLPEMVEKAIQVLEKNPKGYFLLVESGRIDHAHHDSLARLSLHEAATLDDTVQRLTELTSEDDTLLTVTADHSHVFTMGGYPSRGNDILGTVDWYPPGETPRDSLPFLTLSYTNGPQGRSDGPRQNYSEMDTTGYTFVQPADVNIEWESHGGEEVPIYSRGPMSHLFHTTHEQSYIAHVMMYAACIGDYASDEDCDRLERSQRMDPELCAGTRPQTSLLIALGLLVSFFCMRHVL